MDRRDPDHILPLVTWQLSGSASWEGKSREARAARRGWHGHTLTNVSPYERVRAHRFCDRVRKEGSGALLSRMDWSDDHDPNYKIYYTTPEVGVWFERAEDYLSFVGQIELWPKRSVEFMIDREPTKEETKVLDRLNHLILHVVERETGDDKWLVSTEYDTRVVEFKLRLA